MSFKELKDGDLFKISEEEGANVYKKYLGDSLGVVNTIVVRSYVKYLIGVMCFTEEDMEVFPVNENEIDFKGVK